VGDKTRLDRTKGDTPPYDEGIHLHSATFVRGLEL